MGLAQSNMSIADAQLVTIEIATGSDRGGSRLRLVDRGRNYDLVRAFAIHKLDLAQQQLQQLKAKTGDRDEDDRLERYLLVREVNYYSLWELARSPIETANLARQLPSPKQIEIELQQASIWLFQELWLQWQDLLGAKQLEIFAEQLIVLVPQLKSRAEIDRLLLLDPLATTQLATWSAADLIAFDRQLYHLAQKKMGHQFGTQLTIDIIQAMPDSLQAKLTNILDI